MKPIQSIKANRTNSFIHLNLLYKFCFFGSSTMSQQAFNAGQTKGQAREKAEQWTESAKQTAQSARDKTAEVAQSAHDKAIDVTHSAQNKSADKSHSTRESAQHGQEQTTGFLGQQTGESVKNMAQGALDGVKNSLGMNEKK
ncbi:unnamed protein product [Brassica oleracea var. botrytis]|nr:unnamed protein product [Brassica napus]